MRQALFVFDFSSPPLTLKKVVAIVGFVMKTKCPFCGDKKWFWKNICSECQTLFNVVSQHFGTMGLGQLMDELIKTGIPKPKIQRFLETNVAGKGSIMDQILAGLTNNLASGIGVKDAEMTAQDVRRIRENPTFGSSTKPIKD
jgi:hypothetical protein